jgi:hypothetical protein
MSAATDMITISRGDFRMAVARCAKLFRDTGLEQEDITPNEVKLMTTVAVGFCSGLETELFKNTED